VLITTVISLVVFAAFYFAFDYGLINFRQPVQEG